MILQYNIIKLCDKIMIFMLQNLQTWKYDILAIQKLWRNFFTVSIHHFCRNCFHIIYFIYQDLKQEFIKVCFFVNTCLDKTQWIFKKYFKDLITLNLYYTENNKLKCLYIYNIYCEAVWKNITESLNLLNSILKKNSEKQHLMIENFNLHHST